MIKSMRPHADRVTTYVRRYRSITIGQYLERTVTRLYFNSLCKAIEVAARFAPT